MNSICKSYRTLLAGTFFVISVLFGQLPSNAQSGCCSRHDGICGCECCDGTPLSVTCQNYYPECQDKPVQQPVQKTPPSVSKSAPVSSSSGGMSSYKQRQTYSDPIPTLPRKKAARKAVSYSYDGGHVFAGYPSMDCKLLKRNGYVLCHDPETKVADWVSYNLRQEYLIKSADRSDDFRPDPDLPAGQRAELADYARSGYDRGHLAPAGDMTRGTKCMSESFLLSNMAPQIGPGFNRGIWKSLEEKVRSWAEARGDLYIITGPIYECGDKCKAIGLNRVQVPTHFYKIILSLQGSDIDAIAFILPNEKNSSDRLPEFITTIDEIEERTGLDFCRELKDDLEDQMEAYRAEMWE